jgi:hypothetical protein
MPFVYNAQLATPGTLTTNGSANTETETLFLKPGSTAPVYLQMLSVNGKGAASSTLSAVELRTGKWGTASTSGTALSFAPKDGSSTAAVSTGSSRSTAGTTRTNAGPIVSCSITGSNSWRDNDPDNMVSVRAGNAGSIFVADLGTSASMVFSFSAETREF